MEAARDFTRFLLGVSVQSDVVVLVVLLLLLVADELGVVERRWRVGESGGGVEEEDVVGWRVGVRVAGIRRRGGG